MAQLVPQHFLGVRHHCYSSCLTSALEVRYTVFFWELGGVTSAKTSQDRVEEMRAGGGVVGRNESDASCHLRRAELNLSVRKAEGGLAYCGNGEELLDVVDGRATCIISLPSLAHLFGRRKILTHKYKNQLEWISITPDESWNFRSPLIAPTNIH